MPSSIYRSGKSAYNRILIYKKINSGSSVGDIATALVELGDWSLVFHLRYNALKYYQEAYELLIEEQVAVESIAYILSPDIPVSLPIFSKDPIYSEDNQPNTYQKRQYQGYIDVTFNIDKYGKSSGFLVLDKSSNTTRDIEKRLRRHINKSTFRPRFIDGRLARSDNATLRYYYSL